MKFFRFYKQLLVIIIIGILFSATEVNNFYSDSWALLIGIDKYHNWSQLNYAVSDAERMQKLLTEKLGFPNDNVHMLLDEEATLLNIKTEMNKLKNLSNVDDRVLIYFAGHGITVPLPNEGEEGYLIPVDGGEEDVLDITAYPMSAMRRFSDRVPAKKMLFLMDACYSGLMGVRGLKLDSNDNMVLNIRAAGNSRTVITAGRKGQVAQERPAWGTSAMVKSLLYGLEEGVADANNDGYITDRELADHMMDQVTADTDGAQTPSMSHYTSEKGMFVFIIDKVDLQIENEVEDELSELKEQMKIQQEQMRIQQEQLKIQQEQMANMTAIMKEQPQQRQQVEEKEIIEAQSDSKEESEIVYESDKLEALDEEMAELDEEMEELSGEMGLLTVELNSLQDEIEEAEDMEEGKGGEIKRLKSEMGRVGGEMGRLGGEMGRLGGEMGRVGGDIEKLKKQKQDSLNEIIEKLKELGLESEEIAKNITQNIPFLEEDEKEEKKLADNTTFTKSPTHFFDEFGWARYNRSEGLYLQVNKTFQSEFIPGSSFYGGIGRAFHRNEYQWIFGYEQLAFKNIFQFYFEAFDKSITPDAWKVWDGENSLAAFFLKRDYLDWYRGNGFRSAGFMHIKNYISLGIEYNQVNQSQMNNVLEGEKFNNHKSYKIMEGDNNYLKYFVTMGYPIDIEVRNKLQFYLSLVSSQSEGSKNNSYIKDHLFLNILAPYTSDLNFNIKVLAGASNVSDSIWNRDGYHQNIFALGGKGTLRGYEWKQFPSSHYFLTTLEIWFDEFGILYDRAVIFESPGNQFSSDFLNDLSENISTNVKHSAGISFGDEDVSLSFIRQLNGNNKTNIYLTFAFGVPLQYW